jgi:serine/threonine-protein kinase
MNPALWPQVKSAFSEAMERPASQRSSFLLTRCPDPELLCEVHRLIQLEPKAARFLSEPLELEPVGATEILEPGASVRQRYRIDRLIGSGGMCGGVYQAFDTELEIGVALKVVPDSREFLAARSVTHPNVCRVFDCGRDGAVRFLTMELLIGQTLEERLATRGPLEGAELAAFVRQICAGLSAAHEAGVLHRDLKPANVFLTAGGRVVLTDFGLAHTAGAASTSRQLIGTLPYMAPELFAGRSATVASDIYSLGVLLHEASTGKLPVDSAEVPRRWRRALRNCLQLDPGLRPKSVAELSRASHERFRRAFAFLWA